MSNIIRPAAFGGPVVKNRPIRGRPRGTISFRAAVQRRANAQRPRAQDDELNKMTYELARATGNLTIEQMRELWEVLQRIGRGEV